MVVNLRPVHRKIIRLMGEEVEKCYFLEEQVRNVGLSQLLANYSPEQIKGNLIIITENRIRIRPHIRLI